MKPFSLEHEQFILRPLTMADAQEIAQICQDPLIQKWTTVPSPYTLDDAETFVTLTHRYWDSDQPHWLMDIDGTIAGVISFHAPLKEGRRTEIGFWMRSDFRGQGLMTQAVHIACKCAFHYGVQAITWCCQIQGDEVNHASVRVAQKSGFQYDGRCRRALFNKDHLVDGLFATLTPDDPIVDTAPWPHQ